MRIILPPEHVPEKIRAKVAEIQRALPGTVHFTVLHDEWCAMMNDGDTCDCEPDVLPGPIENHTEKMS